MQHKRRRQTQEQKSPGQPGSPHQLRDKIRFQRRVGTDPRQQIHDLPGCKKHCQHCRKPAQQFSLLTGYHKKDDQHTRQRKIGAVTVLCYQRAKANQHIDTGDHTPLCLRSIEKNPHAHGQCHRQKSPVPCGLSQRGQKLCFLVICQSVIETDGIDHQPVQDADAKHHRRRQAQGP